MISCTYDVIAMIGTSDQSCWLAEACNFFLLLLPYVISLGFFTLAAS